MHCVCIFNSCIYGQQEIASLLGTHHLGAAAPLEQTVSPIETNEVVKVTPPPAGLESHVLCAIWREVTGAEGAKPIPGTVPANTYACLNLIDANGHVRLSGSSQRLPPFFITGPFTAPLDTEAFAPLRSVSVVLQPWLLDHWFGLSPQRVVDSIHDLDDVGVPNPVPQEVRQDLLECFSRPELLTRALVALASRSDGFRAKAEEASELVEAISRCHSIARAAEEFGLSQRHFMRKFETAVGLKPVAWRRVKRFESALSQIASDASNEQRLGFIAADAGYSDQAHMTREFKAITGSTPSTLRDGLQSDTPGLWAFKPAQH